MFATPLPVLLRETISEFGMNAVDAWWGDLDEPSRQDVIQLWEECSFGQSCDVRVGGRFVDATDSDAHPELWHNDFYEYLINHEIYLVDPRPFHICTRHRAARAAAAAGFIPVEFICPLAQEHCPMRHLLVRAAGQAVRLRLEFTPEPKVIGEPGHEHRGQVVGQL